MKASNGSKLIPRSHDCVRDLRRKSGGNARDVCEHALHDSLEKI